MNPIWQTIKDHLENERQRINEEIRNYPPPIPACDAQFNYLLEERNRIAQELDRMKEPAEQSLMQKDAIRYIDEFIKSSRFISSEAEQRIRSSMLGVTASDP